MTEWLKSFLAERMKKPMLQFIDGTLIHNPRFFYKVYEGYAFSVSKRFAAVAPDSAVEIYFENPSDSGREIYIIALECTTLAQAWVDVYRGVSITASGTAITPVNLNFASTITSVANVEYGGTYDTSEADLVHETVVPGGSKKEAIGALAEVGESVVVPPDTTKNLLARITNKSASDTDMSIRIMWWEEE